MDDRVRPALLRIAGLLSGVLLLLFGVLVSLGGFRVASQWRAISPAYAAVGVLWAAAGFVMLACAVGAFASGGRHRVALWAGGAGAGAAGLSLIIGVLTYVVPCAGPS